MPGPKLTTLIQQSHRQPFHLDGGHHFTGDLGGTEWFWLPFHHISSLDALEKPQTAA